jgi:hypothetical protein
MSMRGLLPVADQHLGHLQNINTTQSLTNIYVASGPRAAWDL